MDKRMHAFVAVLRKKAKNGDHVDIDTTWESRCTCEWCVKMDAEMLLLGVMDFIQEHQLDFEEVLAMARLHMDVPEHQEKVH